ncbi:TetR/AcrR family transcriptional regulator [Streptomyces sp. NPDC006798]|uniref:TetR/AcrR family transcriptional regulator n=1 Tax=Streptomyces sp. NPDC006798 TaxID=3155462 RepID=UPI0033D07F37
MRVTAGLPPAGRAAQIVAAAREILERDGAAAMSTRAIADRVGIRAPSLYKHFPDKAAVENALVVLGMTETADRLAAVEAIEPGLLPLARAYRGHALAHPHMYRLPAARPLPRHALPEGLEERTAAPLHRAVGGDPEIARATWAFAHGMVMLELDGRFPPGADLDPAWVQGCTAFEAAAPARHRSADTPAEHLH